MELTDRADTYNKPLNKKVLPWWEMEAYMCPSAYDCGTYE